MRKKHLFFAALFFAALSLGFVSCENPDDEPGFSLENVGQDDANSDKENAEGSTDGDGTTPSAPEEPMLVATGGATDVAYSSVTLWGRINTDTLWVFPNIKWGIECSTSKETIRSHSGNKTLCTTDLVGENFDEYTVAFAGLEGGKMLYYNAYLFINDMKYIYGEVDSVHLDVRLTVKSNNTSYGTVTGSGTYDHLAEVTITATLKENCYFAGWSDCDSKELTRTITLTCDSTITANFSLNPCLTVQVNNSNYGTVTGSGLYEKGTEATITATPKANCYFTSWSDGVADNPRTVVVNSDTTFTAKFAKKPYLTVNTNNTSYGTVTGSGYYMPGDVATITATPKANCYFTSWSDGVADNPRTVVVNSDITFTANFAKKPYLTVNANWGEVSGSGYYMPGDEVTITATPNSGAYFVKWNDGNTDNSRTVTINEDITYTATFAGNPNGTENGYEWVDLGLSVKWATCNVGATKPEKYGNYYSWGETTTKSYYSISDYTYSSNPTTLPLNEDAAAVNMGGSWRMPTEAELDELLSECTCEWTNNNGTGVAGLIVTSKINGNSIFLPAAGYRYFSDLLKTGSYGRYWSSSLYTDDSATNEAVVLAFHSSYVNSGDDLRYPGNPVRGVCP